MPRHTGKRSRPKAEIEPIRVSELLTGAGMRGFLRVLEPPVAVPHLRQLAVRAPVSSSQELAEWLLARTEALLRQLGGQQESLAAIAEVARRTQGSAERLGRLAEGIRFRTMYHAAWLTACDGKRGESWMKRVVAARALRNSAPEAGWQEWISETPASRGTNKITEVPRPLAAEPDPADLHEAIARLAYEHWLERGCPCGSPEEDWFHAERQLLQTSAG